MILFTSPITQNNPISTKLTTNIPVVFKRGRKTIENQKFRNTNNNESYLYNFQRPMPFY